MRPRGDNSTTCWGVSFPGRCVSDSFQHRGKGGGVTNLSQVPVVNIRTQGVIFDNCSSGFSMSSIRVLVVEDFAPFLEFICSTLRKESRLEIIGEVSDGLEAVWRAEELRPDLILIDIGLPTLNGLEATRQIHNLAPESKIVFLTQESSADVVQEALNLGARGYVVKGRAEIDLLAAVEAVLDGGLFVSSGLSDPPFTDMSPRSPADY